MLASSTLVNTAESAELRLVHLLGDHQSTSPFVTACEECVAGADAARLVRIVLDHDPAWKLLMSHSVAGSVSGSTGKGGSGGPDEAIGAVGLLAALLGRVSDADVCRSLLRGMIDRIESYEMNADQGDGSDNDDESKSSLVQLKLGMMCALYNLRSKPTEKCWLLGRILTLAGSCNIPNVQYSLLPERNTALGRLLIPKELERLINDDFGGSTIAAVSSTSSTSLSTETKSNDNNTNDAPLTPEVIRTLYRIASDVVGTVAIACRVRGDAMEKEARAAVATQQTFLLMMLKTYTTMVSGSNLEEFLLVYLSIIAATVLFIDRNNI